MEEKETLFKNLIEFILGKKFWFLSFGIFLLIFSAVGLQKIQVNSNFDQWFSADDPLMKAKKNFEKTFGNSDTEAILFRSDNVFSYESLELIQELTQELETKVPQLDKVISLTSFEFSYADGDTVYIGDLIPEEIPHDMNELQKIKEKALQKENIINQLFSDNMQETWILIRLRNFDEAFQKEHEVEGGLFYIGKQIDQIIHQPKYKKYSLHTAGVIALAHDQTTFFEKEASALLGTAFLMALLLLIVFTRSFVGTLVPLFTVISSIVVTYGMMGHLQIPVEANMMTYPIFIGLAVSIGYAIHLHNAFSRYFRETKERKKSVVFAWQNHIWALTFTAVTTVAALLTLNSASIVSIRWVGNASASVVTVSFFFVIIFLPIFLSPWTSPQKKKNKEPQAKNSQPSNKQTTKRIFFRSRSTVNYIPFAEKLFTNLAYFVIKNSKLVAVIFFTIIFFISWGWRDAYIDFEPIKSLGLKTPYVKKMYDVAQSKIGVMYSYDISIEFAKEGEAKSIKNLQKLQELTNKIKTLPLTKTTMSILTVLQDMNQTLHYSNPDFYRIPQNDALVSQLLLLYESSGGTDAEYWVDYDYKILRLQVGVGNFSALEVERELEQIRNWGKEIFPQGKLEITGSFVEGAMVNLYVAKAQLTTLALSLVIIFLLMNVAFGSVKLALLGMIPNLVPVAVTAGVLGYSGHPLNMAMITIAPMILGISVDDTIHLISHIKDEIKKGNSTANAIVVTFKTVGVTLFMTTTILVLIFSIYFFSVVTDYKMFALLVGSGLASALLADYFLVAPILLWTKAFKEGKDE